MFYDVNKATKIETGRAAASWLASLHLYIYLRNEFDMISKMYVHILFIKLVFVFSVLHRNVGHMLQSLLLKTNET